MRWRTEYQRVIKCFAIFPINARIEGSMDHEWRWLETVYLLQDRDWLFGVACFPIWRNIHFVNEHYYNSYINNKKERRK
jgi:hypothetical protein